MTDGLTRGHYWARGDRRERKTRRHVAHEQLRQALLRRYGTCEPLHLRWARRPSRRARCGGTPLSIRWPPGPGAWIINQAFKAANGTAERAALPRALGRCCSLPGHAKELVPGRVDRV